MIPDGGMVQLALVCDLRLPSPESVHTLHGWLLPLGRRIYCHDE